MNYSMQSPGGTIANQSTSWKRISDVFNHSAPAGYALSRTYDTTRSIAGTTVDCTAYEYVLLIHNQRATNYTFYVSKSVEFPVEFKCATAGSVLDLVLVRTNISRL